ncbi:MAG: amidohydrolase family protein, partial [Gemmatimonadota bacterium]|nr:amidohydrolase family protein [Gemmatimonadota bacterium]
VVAALGRAELPTVVHVRNREDGYGAEDVRIFIDEVLPAAPDLPVQIAHMAGWGGYDGATDAALGAFIEAIRAGRLDASRVTFDLAAVVFQPEAAGADTALARSVREANARLAERIEELGAERVVFATDWPSWPPGPEPAEGIAANLRLLETALPLGDAAWRVILSNVNAVLGTDRPEDGPDR